MAAPRAAYLGHATQAFGVRQTSAAESLNTTESLFAKNHEPFFNTIGHKQK
jgi:hypothetical protein